MSAIEEQPLETIEPIELTPLQQIGTDWAQKIESGEIVREGLWENYLSVELLNSGAYAWYEKVVFPVQWLLESIHSLVGIPWWGTIVAVSVLLRVALLPIYVKQQQVTQKLAQMSPQLEAVNEELKRNPHLGPEIGMKIRDIYLNGGASPLTVLKYAFMQVPVFLLFFFSIRYMCETFPEMTTGGVGFFTDLSAQDPYMRLPIISSLSSILLIETQPSPKPIQPQVKWFLRAMMVGFVFISSMFPMGLHIYWITSGLISAATALAFRNPIIRKQFDLEPLKLATQPLNSNEEPEPTPTTFNSSEEPEPTPTNSNSNEQPEPTPTNSNEEPEPTPTTSNSNEQPEPTPSPNEPEPTDTNQTSDRKN